MKITGITLVRLSLPLAPPFPAAWDPEPRRHFPATVVLVDTDEGVRGVGSGDSMDGFEGYTGLFIGTDPLALARQVRVLETVAFHGCRPWPLEAALWDIAGQVAGPSARVDMALAAAEMGFQAMKIRIDPARLSDGLAAVTAVREALPGLTLMVDLNQGWRMPGDVRPPLDRAAARSIAVRLAELDVYWMEEPLSGTDASGLAALRSDCPVRVAGGEMARSYAELTALVEADALDVYQPDAVLAVGISRARTIAEHVLAKGRLFSPHTWTNGIGLLANLHLAAGVGGGPYLEYPFDPPGWTPARRDFMLSEPVGVSPDGHLLVGDRPGLGITLDEDALRHHEVS